MIVDGSYGIVDGGLLWLSPSAIKVREVVRALRWPIKVSETYLISLLAHCIPCLILISCFLLNSWFLCHILTVVLN